MKNTTKSYLASKFSFPTTAAIAVQSALSFPTRTAVAAVAAVKIAKSPLFGLTSMLLLAGKIEANALAPGDLGRRRRVFSMV